MSSSWLRKHRSECSITLVYVAFLVMLAIVRPGFFKPQQLCRVSREPKRAVLVAAVGMTLVIVARQIDISIGSQFSICGVVAGLLARAGLPMPIVGLGAITAGSGLGALNGLLVAGLGLPSIVVTLATLFILGESLRWIRGGEFVRGIPPGFQWFGLGQMTGQQAVLALAFLVFVAFAWGMRNLAAMRAVYATGSDAEAARLAGIRPRLVVFGVFVTMGAAHGPRGRS